MRVHVTDGRRSGAQINIWKKKGPAFQSNEVWNEPNVLWSLVERWIEVMILTLNGSIFPSWLWVIFVLLGTRHGFPVQERVRIQHDNSVPIFITLVSSLMQFQGVKDGTCVLFLLIEKTWKLNQRCRYNYQRGNLSIAILKPRVLQSLRINSLSYINMKSGDRVSFIFL